MNDSLQSIEREMRINSVEERPKINTKKFIKSKKTSLKP